MNSRTTIPQPIALTITPRGHSTILLTNHDDNTKKKKKKKKLKCNLLAILVKTIQHIQ